MRNQRHRLRYDEHRRLGLPVTSSYVESTVKQINRRMKGTEKFWSQGAEPMLTLAAGRLSDTPVLYRFWRDRHARLAGLRCYHQAPENHQLRVTPVRRRWLAGLLARPDGGKFASGQRRMCR